MKGTIVAQNGILHGVIKPTVSLVGTLKPSGVIVGQMCMKQPIVVPSTQDVYEGSYDVTPKTMQQTLQTAEKYMLENVTVRKIPYYESSNSGGGSTVYIGTEVI